MTNYDILVVCVVYYRILNERTCVAVCFYFWLLWCFYCLFFDFLLHFCFYFFFFFFSSRRRHTRWTGDWGSDVCSSDLFADARHHRCGDGLDGGDAEPGRPEQARPWHRGGLRGHDLWRGAGQHVHAADGGATEGAHRQADTDARNPDRRPGVDRPGRQPAADRGASAGLCRMRRHKHEEHTNHEAWAIPYADLMTLLLAFFVVMYAVSVVNEGKFRVMSESLIEAFNGSSHVIAPLPPTRIRPHNISPSIAAPAGQPGSSIVPIAVPIPPHPVPVHGDGSKSGHRTNGLHDLTRIEDQVRKALQPL